MLHIGLSVCHSTVSFIDHFLVLNDCLNNLFLMAYVVIQDYDALSYYSPSIYNISLLLVVHRLTRLKIGWKLSAPY
jgi:hypothetical protein